MWTRITSLDIRRAYVTIFFMDMHIIQMMWVTLILICGIESLCGLNCHFMIKAGAVVPNLLWAKADELSRYMTVLYTQLLAIFLILNIQLTFKKYHKDTGSSKSLVQWCTALHCWRTRHNGFCWNLPFRRESHSEIRGQLTACDAGITWMAIPCCFRR